MNHISLFTGYAGFELGLRLAGIRFRTVLYVEINKKRQAIIGARVRDGLLDDAPIWDDVRTLRGGDFAGLVDLITAGFPCQPHSSAGKGEGAADPRNLWPDTLRLLCEIRPRWALLENVPGIAVRRNGRKPFVLTVLGDLAAEGYDAVWEFVSAKDIGATHERKRWWCLVRDTRRCGWQGAEARARLAGGEIPDPDRVRSGGSGLADADIQRLEGVDGRSEPAGLSQAGHPGGGLPVFPPGPRDEEGWRRVVGIRPELWPQLADAVGERRGGRDDGVASGVRRALQAGGPGGEPQEAEPAVRRVADGSPTRLDRISALGDGIVPAVVAEFLRRCAAIDSSWDMAHSDSVGQQQPGGTGTEIGGRAGDGCPKVW